MRPGAAKTSTTQSYLPLFEFSRGGMGRVELAALRGARFTRLYAVKRLHPHLAEENGVRAMFLEEGRLAGLLRHPNVVSVLDVGADDRGPFLVMEYVEGVPASRLIVRAAQEGRPLSVQLVARVGAQAARGLHAAHELCGPDGKPLHIIHRDVSPQNILVGFDGQVRVTDFGVAKALDSQARTNTGTLKGKLGYMAPERLRYEPPDRRADLFALGVVLYELLAGARLFDADDGLEVARRILNDPAPDIGLLRDDVPDAFVELLLQLLAKDAALRPATAQDVASRLEAIATEQSLLEGPLDLGAFVARWFEDERRTIEQRTKEALARVDVEASRAEVRRLRRRWLVLGGAGGAGVLAAAGAAFLTWRRAQQRAERERYPLGFIWRRQNDWRPGETVGRTAGNPAPDARGNPTWAYEYVASTPRPDAGGPWALPPTRPLVWDDQFYFDAGSWGRGDNLNPGVAATFLGHGFAPDERGYAPVVRWRNPTRRDVSVRMDGRLKVLWGKGASRPVTVIIAVDRGDGTPAVVFDRQVHRPLDSDGIEELPLALPDLRVGAGQSLVFTFAGSDDRGYVALLDDVRIVLEELLPQAPG